MYQTRIFSNVTTTPKRVTSDLARVSNNSANKAIAKTRMTNYVDGHEFSISDFSTIFKAELAKLGKSVPTHNRTQKARLALMSAYCAINDHYMTQAGMRLKSSNYYSKFTLQKVKSEVVSYYSNKAARAVARMDSVKKG